MVLNGDEYEREDDSNNKLGILKNCFESNENFFEKVATKEFDIVDEIKKYIETIKKVNLSELNKIDFIKIVEKFNEIYLKSCVPAYTRLDDFLEIEVKESITRELGINNTELGEIFKDLATCPNYKKLKYSEEPLDLLKIAKKIKEGNADVDELIKEHMDKYAWMKAPVIVEDIVFEKEDYLQRLGFLKDVDIDIKINNIIEVRKKNDTTYENVLKQYSFSERTLKLIKAMNNCHYTHIYFSTTNILI